MASTYSTSLRLELMATGDQSGTWGDTTNTNLGTLLEQAITGVLSVSQGDAELTLTSTDGASDQARNAVVNLTGAMTGAQNVIVPDANKLYLIKNSTTGGFSVTVKTSAGTGIAVAAGTAQWVYADGTNVVQGLSGTMAVQAPGAVAITGGTISGVAATNLTSLSSTGSTAGFVGFQTISTEAAAAAGPIIDLYRNSATPAVNDILGQLLFSGKDSAGNVQEYASLQVVIADATSASEDSTLDAYVTVAGTRTLAMSLNGSNVPFGVVRTQVFTASGTYTPNANMKYCLIECIGGGGGGGGVTGVLLRAQGGGGGGAGSRSIKLASAADIGASKAVTIGAGGSASSAADGGNGGDTSLGVLCIGKGGSGGTRYVSGAGFGLPGVGGVTGTGDVTGAGASGLPGTSAAITTVGAYGGFGGSSLLGGGGIGAIVGDGTAATAGGAATGYGGGGGGAAADNVTSSAAGGAGTAGQVSIIEYCSA